MLQLPESEFILKKLTDELAPHLHYHSVAHTIDVFKTAQYLAEKENIDAADTKLLLIAALYHDSGYLHQSVGHESVSCKIASEVLPAFGYNPDEVEKIKTIIKATQLPQNPGSKLEEIICDADLDYLGRDDFFETGHKLYLEMLAEGRIANEEDWNRLQVDFLRQHRYFTATAQQLRNKKKDQNLTILLSKLLP